MILKTLIHAVFFAQVIRISAIGEDEPQETAKVIINTLKNLEYDDSAPFTDLLRKSQNNNPQYVNGLNKDLRSDIVKAMYGRAHPYRTGFADIKPKRSWEHVPLIWRKSPKRAWEVVNKLWNNPVIRRKYKNYLKNGKRSDELVEDIPVQQNNENPFWMIDEIGYDIDFDNPLVRNGAEDSDLWPGLSSKRGWESVNPAVWQKKATSAIADIGKRGWEDINWKRNTDGHIRNNLVVPRNGPFGDTSVFDPNVIEAIDEGANLNQLTKHRSDIDIMPQDYLNYGKDIRFDELKSSTGPYDENDIFSKIFKAKRLPDNIQGQHGEIPTLELGNDDILKRSAFDNLCRILFGDLRKCRDSSYFL